MTWRIPGRNSNAARGNTDYLSASVAAKRQTQSRKANRKSRRGGDTMGRPSRDPRGTGEDFRLFGPVTPVDPDGARPRSRWRRG